MSTLCEGCRTPLRPDVAFCTGCGRPAPVRPAAGAPTRPTPAGSPPYPTPPPVSYRRSRAPSWLIAGGSALLAVAVVVAGVLVASRIGATPPAAPPQAPPAVTATGPVPPSYTTAPARPEDALASLAGRDQPIAERTVGYWVPQVSSKTVGTVDAAGVTYDHPTILANHRAWVAAYPDAVLVRSDEYSSFRSAGYWVTLVPRPFPDAEGANRWCATEGLPPEDCFAKRLSHTDGPDGNTEPR